MGFLLLGPLVLFEAVYHYEISTIPTPVLPPGERSKLAPEALWIGAGGEPSREVAMLWLGNFFDVSQTTFPDNYLAHLWLMHGDPGVRHSSLQRAALTVWLSRHASAAELKQALASWATFGRGATGLREATRAYFPDTRAPLNLAQVALLAALLQAPGRYGCHPELALKRREYILKRMADAGLISQTAATAAHAELLAVLPVPCRTPDLDTLQ